MASWLTLAAALVASGLILIPADAAPRLSSKGRMPILAWIGPPASEATVARYRELADCGFTHNFSLFPDMDSMEKGLDAAHKAGIQVFVSVPQIATDPASVAQRFRNHPAIGGYHIRDEPSTADFAKLAEEVKQIQAVDRRHPCYINLFPNYATKDQLGAPSYQAYLDRFLSAVPVPFLSFDHYPVTTSGLRPEYYQNLQLAADAARAAKKPLWAFALAVAHGPYPIAELSHLRLQVFSDLAYGAQGIQYFTYWTVKDPTWNFHEAPIDLQGRRTPVYDRVRQVNREIQGLSGVFLGAHVIRVAHTGKQLPAGTHPFEPIGPVRSVATEGKGAVTSVLENGGRRFLVIVNRDYTAEMPLTVTLDGKQRVERVEKDGTLHPISGHTHASRVAPGDVVVLTWKQ